MNKTKVIATVGPVTSNKEMLKELITNGTDVIRINMSHADMAFCREIVEKINEINMELNTYTAIMIDLKGPIVQVGKVLNKSAFLKQNDKIRIFKEDVLGDNTKFSVDYKEFIKEANVGMILTLSDGDVVLKVIQKENDYLKIIRENFYLSEREVEFIYKGNPCKGIVKGISENGNILINVFGDTIEVSSGEISLQNIYNK